jgi:hypothetical protein
MLYISLYIYSRPMGLHVMRHRCMCIFSASQTLLPLRLHIYDVLGLSLSP